MNIKKLYIMAAALMMLMLSACSESTADEMSALGTEASESITSASSVITTTSETTVTETTTAEETTAETSTVQETTIVETEETNSAEETISPVMEQYLEISDRIDEVFADITEDRDFPVVHILTYNGEQIASKEVYNDTVIDVFNCDEEYRLTAEGGVKVRGNSSANDTVLPYRIKFNEKQNMLGLHEGKEYKSWVLLKSNWNLIPDFMALSLAKEIFDGKYYSSDCTYVNVYINGEFEGIYLLCEHTQAADDRVDVYEPKEGETHTDIGYLIELDNYAGEDPDEPCFFMDYGKIKYTDMLGETRDVEEDGYTIKSDTFSDEQRALIEKYYNGVFKICYEGIENNKPMMFDNDYNVVSAEGTYETPQEAIEAVVDTNSLANMLILEELVHNYDVGAGSFFMAVDFSDTSKYERLTFLAPWDFNWSYEGNYYDAFYAGTFQKPVHDMVERSNIWLIMFMNADWFQDIVKDKWNELQADNSLMNVVYEVCDVATSLEHDLGDEEWRIDSAGRIAEFVAGRIEWLDTVWKK
ncbi:MAG: CotH kinase family protein [Oscillospiraceae bacterium]|nr:CotH kinase family protein [Oscillospiraceae bacterium]